MAKDQRDAGAQSGVEHEVPVSETLKENATAQRAQAEEARGGVLEEGEGSPQKRHGDALETGTGNRHGVHERDRRPEVCD